MLFIKNPEDKNITKHFHCCYSNTDIEDNMIDVLIYIDYETDDISEEALIDYVHLMYNIVFDVPVII